VRHKNRVGAMGQPRVLLAVMLIWGCGNAPDAPPQVGSTPAPAPAAWDSTPARAGLPSDSISSPGESDLPVAAGVAWTAGRQSGGGAGAGVATLRALRSAGHEDFDRIVLDFGADPLPSWEVEYIDRPVRQCGSGDAVDIAGDGWLKIHLQPARAHDDQGRATVGERRRRLDHGVLRELVATCDFEAHLEWVAGAASPNSFRVFELREPSRLVVDVRKIR
jgi:hypothetical protein